MPGSEYYDREPSPEEAAREIQWKTRDRQNWEHTLSQLQGVRFQSHRKLEAILDQAKDYVKARIWEIRV